MNPPKLTILTPDTDAACDPETGTCTIPQTPILQTCKVSSFLSRWASPTRASPAFTAVWPQDFSHWSVLFLKTGL